MQFYRLPITFCIIGACVVVYVAVTVLGTSASPPVPWNVGLVNQPSSILGYGELLPAAVARGYVWLLLTSMFLHAGFIHLSLNMLSLYFVGSFTELTFGKARFLALYLLSGLAGGIAYLYFGGFATPVVGASGAIFGLLGGIFGYTLRQGTFSWENPLIRQLLILTALNLAFGFSVQGISNTAHIGGLTGGLIFGWLTAPTLYSSKALLSLRPTALALGAEVLLLGAWLFYYSA
ncbi:MAG: rhomboid family intramembrane serine protease [Rubrobacteraceae bacterium]